MVGLAMADYNLGAQGEGHAQIPVTHYSKDKINVTKKFGVTTPWPVKCCYNNNQSSSKRLGEGLGAADLLGGVKLGGAKLGEC